MTDWSTCNLGLVPPNVVVTRPVAVTKVYNFLVKSQVSHKGWGLFFDVTVVLYVRAWSCS